MNARGPVRTAVQVKLFQTCDRIIGGDNQMPSAIVDDGITIIVGGHLGRISRCEKEFPVVVGTPHGESPIRGPIVAYDKALSCGKGLHPGHHGHGGNLPGLRVIEGLNRKVVVGPVQLYASVDLSIHPRSSPGSGVEKLGVVVVPGRIRRGCARRFVEFPMPDQTAGHVLTRQTEGNRQGQQQEHLEDFHGTVMRMIKIIHFEPVKTTFFCKKDKKLRKVEVGFRKKPGA